MLFVGVSDGPVLDHGKSHTLQDLVIEFVQETESECESKT